MEKLKINLNKAAKCDNRFQERDFPLSDNQICKFMERARELAIFAGEEGNAPFGALLVSKEGDVMAQAYNTSKANNVTSQHAEINLIAEAEKTYSKSEISQAVLIVNAESCGMCTTHTLNMGIRYFVYGAPIEGHTNPHIHPYEIAEFATQPTYMLTEVDIERNKEVVARFRKKKLDQN